MRMTTRFRKSLWMAALVGAALLGTATRARANLELDLQEDGGTVVKINVANDQGPATFSGKLGLGGAGGTDFTIFISVGFSNSPGGINGITNVGTVSITNNTGATHTLHINVSAQDFTSPSSPPSPALDLADTVSGSGIDGTLSGTFQGFADASNALFGTGFKGQLLNFAVSGQSQSFSADGLAHGFASGPKYSETILSSYTLGGGTSMTLTGGNTQTMVPVPAGLVLALSGLPFLGLPLLRRRRKLA
jgi:hypothetical protein